jgi:hypothetical protein
MAQSCASSELVVSTNSDYANVDMLVSPGTSLSLFVYSRLCGQFEFAIRCNGQYSSVFRTDPAIGEEIVLKRVQFKQHGLYTRADLSSVVQKRYNTPVSPNDTGYVVCYKDDGIHKIENCFDEFATHTIHTAIETRLFLTENNVKACLDKHAATTDLAICVRTLDRPDMERMTIHVRLKLTRNTIRSMMEESESDSDEEMIEKPTSTGYMSWFTLSKTLKNRFNYCV